MVVKRKGREEKKNKYVSKGGKLIKGGDGGKGEREKRPEMEGRHREGRKV